MFLELTLDTWNNEEEIRLPMGALLDRLAPGGSSILGIDQRIDPWTILEVDFLRDRLYVRRNSLGIFVDYKKNQEVEFTPATCRQYRPLEKNRDTSN